MTELELLTKRLSLLKDLHDLDIAELNMFREEKLKELRKEHEKEKKDLEELRRIREMQATREDFDRFMEQVKNAIKDDNIDSTCFFDFKDYSDFVHELREFLDNNSVDKWEINTTCGIGIQKI